MMCWQRGDVREQGVSIFNYKAKKSQIGRRQPASIAANITITITIT